MADAQSEQFTRAIAGLKKSDLKTVAMEINGHRFVFSSIETFKNFALVMLFNAVEFEKTTKPKSSAKLRVVN